MVLRRPRLGGRTPAGLIGTGMRDADNAREAVQQLTPYLAERTHASEVRRVPIR